MSWQVRVFVGLWTLEDEAFLCDGSDFALFPLLADPVGSFVTFPVDVVHESVRVDQHLIPGFRLRVGSQFRL
jgi:hypothetical protein